MENPLIDDKSYIEDFSGPSPRARKLAENSDFSAEDWQKGLDDIGEKWTIHAELMSRRTNTCFLRTIEAYRVSMEMGTK